MKFKPLHDRVLIEVLDSSEKTAGGIIIPDTAQEKPQEGKVIAVGGGAKTEDGKIIPMDVKVGDKVLFGKWSGTEVKIDGKEYSIMKESDIMGKIIPMDVKVGDKVLFGKWSGTEVKIDGKEYSIMKESDIMGISSK